MNKQDPFLKMLKENKQDKIFEMKNKVKKDLVKKLESKQVTLVGIKSDLANGYRKFKLGCFVCHAKDHKRGMTFHHLWYLKNEKTYSDFDSPLEYYQYLAPLIRDQPERFLYVCNIHHQAITRLRRWRGANLNRLIKAVRMTR